MDWKSIAGAVVPLAPKLGTVLGTVVAGPLGATIGGLAGTALAGIFGVDPTPEAVGRAIAEDPDAARKIQQVEAERGQEIVAQAQAQIEALRQAGLTARANTAEINETIRAENGKVSWWHWRHLLGYLVLLYGIEQVAAVAYTMFGKGVPPDQLSMLFNSTSFFTLGLFGLLGYVAADSTALKQTAMTGQVPEGIVASTVRAVTGKKK